VPLYNLFADSQTSACPGVLPFAMQPLEDDKDPLEMLRLDPNPIVPHGEEPLVIAPCHSDMNLWSLVWLPELQSIPN